MKTATNKKPASKAVDLLALAEYVERFSTRNVVVLGDFVADSFQFGEISRVSREAPVLILRHRQTELVPGGGANAANNFVSLGAKVIPVTAVGDDAAGDWLIESFHKKKVDVSGIVRVSGWTTPTKTRFLAGWAHTVGQQVLRVDYEPNSPLPEATRNKIQRLLLAKIKKADALAVSDYGFGVVAPSELRQARLHARKDLPVTLDSRYRLTDYRRTSVTAATPNEAELEALHHTAIGKNLTELRRCGEATRAQMKLPSLLVTRGRDGMVLFQRAQSPIFIAVHGSDQAVDVTGAGDTVLATYTLALASGASPLEAAHLANIAGGLVVMKRGTATVSRDELSEAIQKSASEKS
ncbi:MAG TPA: PfkB family carbohydrate kinase [Candidatus Acidoferrum sp.]